MIRRTCFWPSYLGLALLLAVVSIPSLHAQPSPRSGGGDILLEVGSEKYTADQIAAAFNRNANRGGRTFYELDRDSALLFLNLFANYRLKVHSAVDAGLAGRESVKEELRNNRLQLAVPPPPATGYLVEREVVDPAVERIFKRRDDELLIALIYESMNQDNPADTMRAFTSTISMLGQIQNGASFERMARDSSDDPNTKDAGGRLPTWITAGMILPAIEDAAYELKPGEVSPTPIRLPGGYALVKLLDRSPRFKVRAAHILIGADPLAPDTNPQRSRAEAALARIRAGEDFEKVARDVSEDRVSAENGGDFMGYYTRSLGFEAKNARLEPAFEEALFALKDGEVSDIIRTRYGYHIIRRIDSRRPTFEEEKETIRAFYKQRLMQDDRTAWARGVVEKHGLRINQPTLAQILAAVNTTATTADTAWAAGIGEGLRRELLFSYAGRGYTVGAFIDTVNARNDMRTLPLTQEGLRGGIYRLFEQTAMIEEARDLESRYPDFKALMDELRDGILIFTLEDSVVYSRLNKGYDETKGREFFKQNATRYKTAPRLAMTEIFLYKEADVKEIEALLDAGASFDSLAATRTQRSGYRERGGRWGLANPRNADIVKQVLDSSSPKLPKVGAILEPMSYQGGFSILRIDTVEAPRAMSYEEARTEVQSDYITELQRTLTTEWLDTLRLKYGVKINDKTLRRVLKRR